MKTTKHTVYIKVSLLPYLGLLLHVAESLVQQLALARVLGCSCHHQWSPSTPPAAGQSRSSY
jgi:hypothetical protein